MPGDCLAGCAVWGQPAKPGEEVIQFEKAMSRAEEILAWARSHEDFDAAVADARLGRKTMEAILALYQSHAEDKKISLPLAKSPDVRAIFRHLRSQKLK